MLGLTGGINFTYSQITYLGMYALTFLELYF